LGACSGDVKAKLEVNSGGTGGSGGEAGTTGGTAGTTGGSGATGGMSATGGTGGRTGGTGGAGGNTGGMGGAGGADDSGTPDAEVDAGPPMMGMLPLPDLANGGTYMTYEGGLYPDGKNTPPAAHHAAGIELARSVVPLGMNGQPAANGKIVLLSIGMSNATQAFCNPLPSGLCPEQSFVGQATADEDVDDEFLVMVDGATGGQVTEAWLGDLGNGNFNRVRDERLAPKGVTEAQVQVIWMKNARGGPTVGLPSQDAEVYGFEEDFGNIVRRLEAQYPNLKMVFLTSRSYGGWATTTLNPEPYAYEYGFGVKWLIESQINQVASGDTSDTHAGNLDYRDDTAPWLAWGPYLWANGTMPRAYDGFSYQESDFAEDGTHPSVQGQRKIGGLLLQFFKTSPYTRCWFLAAAPECE
jgi:hypothetical protein